MVNIADSLEPLDPEWVREQLSQHPFVVIEGVSNARTLGHYQTRNGTSKTRPVVFRSAEISGITEKGV